MRIVDSIARPKKYPKVNLVEKLKQVDIIQMFEDYGFELIPGGDCTCCKGGYYKMVCPIHADRNPSLQIHPGTASWYCWGCGAGGSAIDFIMEYEDISLSEAAKRFSSKNSANKIKVIRQRLRNPKKTDHSEKLAQTRRWIEFGMRIRDFIPVDKQDEMFYYLDLAFDLDKLDLNMSKKINKKIKSLIRRN